MTRRSVIICAFVVVVASAVIALLLPPRLGCASLGFPEGTRCPEGRRIEFEDHGPFVSIGVDQRYVERFGILVIGTLIGIGILLVAERRPRTSSIKAKNGGAGL
jgi:hypothetical protein